MIKFKEAELAQFALKCADQAMHANNAGIISNREYFVLLEVFSRVHLSYSQEFNKKSNRQVAEHVAIICVFAAFGVAGFILWVAMVL